MSALGALATLFGLLALVMIVTATLTTVFIIAIFMIVTGGTEIMIGFRAKTWGREILLIVAGLAYIVAGAFALAQPGPGCCRDHPSARREHADRRGDTHVDRHAHGRSCAHHGARRAAA